MVLQPSDPNGSEVNEAPFESREQSVHGINISIRESFDWNSTDFDESKHHEISFIEGNDYKGEETVKVYLGAKTAIELYEKALQSVDPNHPQKMYIAYGKTKQELRKLEQEAALAEQRAEEEKEAAYKESLDTSYNESAETPQGTLSIRWREEAGRHGAYVIELPKQEGFQIDRYMPNGADWESARAFATVGMRPDVAKKFFDKAVKFLQGQTSVKDIQLNIEYTLREFDENYLWSQDPTMESHDPFYNEQREVRGIKFRVMWSSLEHEYIVMFDNIHKLPGAERAGIYDSYIRLGKKHENAEKILAYAEAQANFHQGDSIKTFKAVKDMIYEMDKDDDDYDDDDYDEYEEEY